MQKLLNKLTAVFATLILVGTNFMPALVYATETAAQDAKTSEENVEFNATINNSYNALLDVNEEGNLVLNIKVSETGYLKDSKVTIENNNYEIVEKDDLNVKSINGNSIELDEVNAGEVLNVTLPIKLKREEKVSSDILGRDSKVTLNAVYVNKAGKEKKIEKTLTEHLDWSAELMEVVSQELVRYIKLEENKTLVSFKINEGIKDNVMPAESKELNVSIPTLGGNKPEEVIVTGENITSSYEDDMLTIKKINEKDQDGKIAWNSQDEYWVTYVYNTQVEEETVESNVTAKAIVKGNEVEGLLENSKYELKDEVGYFIEGEVDSQNEISKGYMYTNLKNSDGNLETAYEVTYKANIGYKELTDSIKIVENTTEFNNFNASNSIIVKKVKIDKENLTKILGEDGTVKVLSEDGKELGSLSKDKLELDVNVNKVVLETSKIVNEGDLKIVVSKAIIASKDYSKEQIEDLTELRTKVTLEGYKEEKINSSKEVVAVSNFTEPTSNAKVDISADNLSTVVTNENVIITATLETNDINDALYQNAEVSLTLPEEVKDINVKEARLIYEDELELNNLNVNGNKISFNLDGVQTKYSNQATSEGTVVRLVTDLKLDNLAPNSKESVELNYTNESTGEAKTVSKTVGISAPTGFVTTNTLKIDEKEVTSQEKEEQIVKVDTNANEKDMSLSGTIVNNLGEDATGVSILGVIPASGNKDANGNDLGSNFDTMLTSAINVNAENAEVYYSENVNETVDGDGWTTEFTQNAKAYKIVLAGAMAHGDTVNFSYSVKVPGSLEYGKTAKGAYAVYYNNNAEEGNSQNVVISKAVGITTGEIPVIDVKAEVSYFNTKEKIEDSGNVKEGKLITYKAIVTNTGKEVANNVKLNISLPSGISLVTVVYDMGNFPRYSYDNKTKELEYVIPELKSGESKTVEYKLVVVQNVLSSEILEELDELEEELQDSKQIITVNVTADELLTEKITLNTTLNVVKGDIEASVISDKMGKNLKVGETAQYYLEIKNANFEEKNNVIATIVLPKELKVSSVINNEDDKYSYDEKTNTLTYNKDLLQGGETVGVVISLEAQDVSKDTNVNVTAKVKCDEMETEESLETINYIVVKDIISVLQSSSIGEGNISDTDTLEYYIDVKNNGIETINVSVKDVISKDLRVLGYEIKDKNGTKQIDANPREITASLEISAGDTARLTIRVKPYMLQNGRVAKIENKATVELVDGNYSLDTNTLKHTIVGTSTNSAGPSTDPDAGEQGNGETVGGEKTEPGTYIISGTAWLDENADGRKDNAEGRLSNLTVKLYDKGTGSVALDVKGAELVKTTNESGNYTFVNVVPGRYIVVIEYDNVTYDLATYKVEGVAESENSDFVSALLNGSDVAATDELVVENTNTYNIDLGLVRGTIFDLDISKTINRISVTNTKAETKTYDYDNLEVAKVELATKNVDFATVLVEYTIKVQNNGNVAGYAKSIVDHIPEGMTFSSELNSSWYLGQDGNAYNTSLANTIINPGETKEVRLILSKKMTGENTGTVRNTAEILISYNQYGLTDRDVLSGVGDKTDDKSAADVVIAMSTGREIASFTGITLGTLALIALAVYEIKKHIINKMYNNII